MIEQYMMYFKAEIYDREANCKRFEYGFTYAPTIKGAVEQLRKSWYGDEIISIYFEPLAEGPLFTTEQEATNIMERMAW